MIEEDVVARALRLVEEADATIAARDAELAELRVLATHLLESGPFAAVLDDRRRIRGWSSQAALVWSVSVDRAIGQPATSIIGGLDHRAIGEVQVLDTPQGPQRVVIEALDPDERHLLVRML